MATFSVFFLLDVSTVLNMTVDVTERIPVQPNDVLGWYQEPTNTDGMIKYDQALSGSTEYGIVMILPATSSCSQPSVGTSCSWLTVDSGGQAIATVREYSFKAYLEKSKYRFRNIFFEIVLKILLG